MVDFDDLLRLCSRLLETDAAFAAAQRWRFQHLFVDEFQDVNPLQLGLLDAWRGDQLRPVRGRRPPPGHLRLERGRRRLPRGLPPPLPAGRGGRRSTATTARRPRSWRPPPTCSPRAGAGRVVTCAPPGSRRPRRCVLERHPTDRDEVAAIARAVRDRRGPRRRVVGPGGAGPHPRADPARSPRRCGRPASPTGCGAATRCSSGGRCARRSTCCGARAARSPPACPTSRRWRTTRTAPTGDSEEGTPAADLGAGGAAGARPPAPRPRRRRRRLRVLAGGHAAGRGNGDGAATPSPWPRSTPPRAWSGRSCTWRGWRTGWCPSPMPAPSAQRAEEARLLYVAMTRAEDELRCTWAAQPRLRRQGGRAPADTLAGRAGRAPARAPAPSRCRARPPTGAARLAEQRAAAGRRGAAARAPHGGARRPARLAGRRAPAPPGSSPRP